MKRSEFPPSSTRLFSTNLLDYRLLSLGLPLLVPSLNPVNAHADLDGVVRTTERDDFYAAGHVGTGYRFTPDTGAVIDSRRPS